MPDFVSQVTPDQLLGYSQARRRNKLTFGIQQGNYNFARAENKQNQGIEQRNALTQFKQMREKLPQAYAGRGLLNSGIYKQGLADYAQQRVRAFGDLAQKYQQTQGRQNLDIFQQAALRNNADADVAEREKATRAALAASLRGLI